jgi:hypothetical protein
MIVREQERPRRQKKQRAVLCFLVARSDGSPLQRVWVVSQVLIAAAL